MTGMSLSEFLEKVACGDEIEFIFHGKTYFYQGYFENGSYVSVVDCWDEEKPDNFAGYIYEHHSKELSDRLKFFEEANIFDGKNIYEAEKEIKVIYG